MSEHEEKKSQDSKNQQESSPENTKIPDNSRSETDQAQPLREEATVSLKAEDTHSAPASVKSTVPPPAAPQISIANTKTESVAPEPPRMQASSMPKITDTPAVPASSAPVTAIVHAAVPSAGQGGMGVPPAAHSGLSSGAGESSTLGPPLTDAEAERQIRKMSRRSFLWAAGAVAAGFSGWRWLSTRHDEAGLGWPFRNAMQVNEQLSRDYFGWVKEEKGVKKYRLAPEFDKSQVTWIRVNPGDGGHGANTEFNPAEWKLRLLGLEDMSAAVMPASEESSESSDAKSGDSSDADTKSSDNSSGSADTSSEDSGEEESEEETSDPMTYEEPAVELTMKDLMAMPRFEMVTEFKCIEGWSAIIRWGGIRLAELIKKYPPAANMQYVSLTTPDGEYYVGLDMDSAMHPQTMLAYEMTAMDAQGNPLPDAPLQRLSDEHGAPLRLVIPVKYGIKNIKRIGNIKFTAERPRDYWAELGYDWYAGH